MKSKTILFRDPVVERVCDKFVTRSDVGYAKYGRTLHEERTGGHKDLAGYLNDVQEELMDAILYIQAAKEAHEDMKKQLNTYIADDSDSLNEHYRQFPITEAHAFKDEITEANKASFRPPHPSNAAQQDWDDHVAPV